MSKPREWTIENKRFLINYDDYGNASHFEYIQVANGERIQQSEEVKVIEKSAADKLAEALEFYTNISFSQGHGLNFQDIAIEALNKFRGDK